MFDEETEIKIYPEVEIFISASDSDNITQLFDRGSLVVTNCRIFQISQSSISNNSNNSNKNTISGTLQSDLSKKGNYILLRDIAQFEDCSSFFRSSKRVRLISHNKQGFYFKFWNGGKEDFLGVISTEMKKKAWLGLSMEVKPITQQSFSTLRAGVTGIIKKQERDIQEANDAAKESTNDLNALMARAKDMVDLVTKYANYLETKSKGHGLDTESVAGEVNDMEDMLNNIGVIVPVTKLSAGRHFHIELAKQICDIMMERNLLQRLGGMVTLSDLFCIVNRARRTELISPHDLLCACQGLNDLRLPIVYKEFSSGVLSIHLRDQTDERSDQKLLQILSDLDKNFRIGVQPINVAQTLAISITVAKELLLDAESRGLLCRDDSVNGLAFFKNIYFQ